MTTTTTMDEVSIEKIFKGFANRRRISIIRAIRKAGTMSVGHIAEHIRLSLRSTSRHLAVLYAAKILDREQRSLNMIYSLSKKRDSMVDALLTLL